PREATAALVPSSRPGLRLRGADRRGCAAARRYILGALVGSMSRLWQSVVSIWAWLVLVVCVLLWLPLMLLVRLVTAPFDRGRYAVGYLFRQIPVVMVTLNPLWRFRCVGP